MARLVQQQKEVLALVDTSKAMVDKILSLLGMFKEDPNYDLLGQMSPIGFLLSLLKRVGLTKDDIIEFLGKYLVWSMPALELAVKGIILTNLKKTISCSVDPRIPLYFRKDYVSSNENGTANRYGVDVKVDTIDVFNKFSESPLSDEGKYLYFGTEGVKDVYKFARALDFDAFIWFTIHRGRFPQASEVTNMSQFTDNVHGNAATSVTPSDATLLTPFYANYSTSQPSSIMMGNTFKYANNGNYTGAVVAMCIDRFFNENKSIIKCQIVPVSDDLTSVNWYSNTTFKTTIGINNDKNRDYSKEKPIINLQYLGFASNEQSSNGLNSNYLRFSILPKPLVHIPHIDVEKPENPLNFKKLIFNYKGEYDSNGYYTIDKSIAPVYNSDGNAVYTVGNAKITINRITGKVTVNSPSELVRNLKACYKGLTVYEFNYDYVMGMRLFEAKSLVASLLQTLSSMQVSGKISVSPKYYSVNEKVKQIVKNVIESNDGEVTDCFFTFDNKKYDELLTLAEQKRARLYKFGNDVRKEGVFDNVYKLLDEYDENAEKHEKVEILKRVITEASVAISEGAADEDKISVEFNFVSDLINNLTYTLVMDVLSPKILMLLEVNKKMLGDEADIPSLENLLRSMTSLITSIVLEIRDLIIEELKRYLIEKLSPILAIMNSAIAMETIEAYTNAIKQMLDNCPNIRLGLGASLINTTLDQVDYADIDASEPKEDKPKKNC